MAEPLTISEALQDRRPSVEHVQHHHSKKSATAAAAAAEYSLNAEAEEAPTRPEVVGWYVYALCSYFVQSFLLPVIFPLIIAQRASPISSLPPPPALTAAGISCHRNDTILYQMLVHRSIVIHNSKLSPLHWTAISWLAGIIIVAPAFRKIAHSLDTSFHQPFILGVGTAAGSFVLLLTGFFKTMWLFPFYIVIVTAAIIAASATHTRHLGLLVRGLTGDQVHQRPPILSRMSLIATSVGSLSTAVIALFTYHMLRRADHLTSLWVVSIFCGLKWFLGVIESFFSNRPGSPSASLSLLPRYDPYIVGRLGGVFLSSFSLTCIFTSASLYILGSLCIKPTLFLTLWMAYFLFSTISLPVLHPFQLLIRADSVKMNILGLMLSSLATGLGFYFKDYRWHWVHILLVVLVQSAAAGILQSFGRVMILERSPPGKEGVFSSMYEWMKASGACAGFSLAAVFPENIKTTFGFSFVAVFVAMMLLVFASEASSFNGGSSQRKVVKEEESEEGSFESGMKKEGEQSREYIGSGGGSNLGGGSVQV